MRNKMTPMPSDGLNGLKHSCHVLNRNKKDVNIDINVLNIKYL